MIKSFSIKRWKTILWEKCRMKRQSTKQNRWICVWPGFDQILTRFWPDFEPVCLWSVDHKKFSDFILWPANLFFNIFFSSISFSYAFLFKVIGVRIPIAFLKAPTHWLSNTTVSFAYRNQRQKFLVFFVCLVCFFFMPPTPLWVRLSRYISLPMTPIRFPFRNQVFMLFIFPFFPCVQ